MAKKSVSNKSLEPGNKVLIDHRKYQDEKFPIQMDTSQ